MLRLETTTSPVGVMIGRFSQRIPFSMLITCPAHTRAHTHTHTHRLVTPVLGRRVGPQQPSAPGSYLSSPAGHTPSGRGGPKPAGLFPPARPPCRQSAGRSPGSRRQTRPASQTREPCSLPTLSPGKPKGRVRRSGKGRKGAGGEGRTSL